MSTIQYFSSQPDLSEIPTSCRNPFDNNPHPLALLASKKLQQRLTISVQLTAELFTLNSGKMFGVLVIADHSGRVGYLSGFSGMLNKQWLVPGFVPPVFNVKQQQELLSEGESQVAKLTQEINRLSESPQRIKALVKLAEFEKLIETQLSELKQQHQKNKSQRRTKRSGLADDEFKTQRLNELSQFSQQDKRQFKQVKSDLQATLYELRGEVESNFENEINTLILQRKKLSQYLHDQVFEGYQIVNGLGEVESLSNLFDGKTPPGGTADCALPKLIQFAHKKQFKILAMAEFWWGAPPLKGIRHHANFYPPCRGKCFPILPFALKGIEVEKSIIPLDVKKIEPEIVYEDDSLVVVNKPAGLLSIPGKDESYSVLSWLHQRYPDATGALLVHRLDMATSGLLVAAKNAQVHKHLQRQFLSRSIKKRYVAVLSKVLTEQNTAVNLPIRVDLDDRPRQLVCYQYGKPALTYVKFISTNTTSTRVYLYPVTGRTHQLRVHAAHINGLNAPIIGDELYGVKSRRLLLHAEKISFIHPVTGNKMDIKSAVPF